MSEEPLLTSIAGSNSSSMGYSSIPPKSIAEVRPELPTHLVTQRQRWIALWLTAAAMSLSSGPVASWPTLEPLLIDAGVWKGGNTHSNLDVVYGIATAVQMGASLPAGWIYDRCVVCHKVDAPYDPCAVISLPSLFPARSFYQ